MKRQFRISQFRHMSSKHSFLLLFGIAILLTWSDGITGEGFIENGGQLADPVEFYVQGQQGSIFFTSESIVVDLWEKPEPDVEPALPEEIQLGFRTLKADSPQRKGCAVWIRFAGANPDVVPEVRGVKPGESNFFLGNDADRWATNVRTYSELVYPDLWPGIDLVYWFEGGRLASRLESAPGTDLSRVAFSYEGADRVVPEGPWQKRIETSAGTFRHLPPYENDQGRLFFEREDVPMSGSLKNDPGALDWCTFLGGSYSGPSWYDWEDASEDVVVDDDGYVYIVGDSFSSDFPVTPGSYDTGWNGYYDVTVTKLNPDGASLVYSTFIGGNSNDYGVRCVLSDFGAVYVAGVTHSDNFPTTPGAYDTSYNGHDAIIFKLGPGGDTLEISTHLGGPYEIGQDVGYEYAWDIALDLSGNIYVVGNTDSPDFPVLPGAYDPTHNGGYDGFVARFDPTGSTLEYSTFLGGAGFDRVNSIDIGDIGQTIVCGYTNSLGFPTTPGAFSTLKNGEFYDGFVSSLNTFTSALYFSTFLGSSVSSTAYGLEIDGDGKAYVTGMTYSYNPGSADFPVTAGAFDESFNGGWDAYLVRLGDQGSTLEYGTYCGGSGSDKGWDVAVDGHNNVYLTGSTFSIDFPVTHNAFDTSFNDSSDVFVTVFNDDATGLRYSSFLGGNDDDDGGAIYLDPEGAAYVSGSTQSVMDFPATPGAFDTSFNGGDFDGFVFKMQAGGPRTWLVPSEIPTIQGAYDLAMAGDRIEVAGGTYYEHSITPKDGVLLVSDLGSGDTIIDADSLGPVFQCENLGAATRIEGFTITGGEGGGMTCLGSSLSVVECVFTGNHASLGAGLACSSSSPVLENCVFYGNTADTNGGAIHCMNSSPGLVNCTLADNTAAAGAGLYASVVSNPTIQNSIIAFNGPGAAVYTDLIATSVTLTCSDVFGNLGGDWVGSIAPQAATNGNMSLDPEFCGNAANPAQPYSLNDTSPCTAASNPGCGLVGAGDVGCSSFPGVSWTGSGDGSTWEDGANWSSGSAPGVGEDVRIGLSGAYTLVMSSMTTVRTLTLDAADGQPTLALISCALQSTHGISNACNILVSPNSGLNIDPGAQIDNLAGGTITLDNATLGGGGMMNNLGTVEAVGDSDSRLAVTFNNSQPGGNVQIDSGRLRVDGPFENASTINLTAGGNMSVEDNLVVTADGALNVHGWLSVYFGSVLSVEGRFELFDGATCKVESSDSVLEFVDGGEGYVTGASAELYAFSGGEIRVVGTGSMLEMNSAGKARSDFADSRIRAVAGGTVVATGVNSSVTSRYGGTVESDGAGSRVRALNGGLVYAGGEDCVVQAVNEGIVEADGVDSKVVTQYGGLVLASGGNSVIKAVNSGQVVSFEIGSFVKALAGGQVLASGGGSLVDAINNGKVEATGTGSRVRAVDGGQVRASGSGSFIQAFDTGAVESDGPGSIVQASNEGRLYSRDDLSTIHALNGGAVVVGSGCRLQAMHGGDAKATGPDSRILASAGGMLYGYGLNSIIEAEAGGLLKANGTDSSIYVVGGAKVSVHGFGGVGLISELMVENEANVVIDSGCQMRLFDFGIATVEPGAFGVNQGWLYIFQGSSFTNNGTFYHRTSGMIVGWGTFITPGGSLTNDGGWSPGSSVIGRQYFEEDFTLSSYGKIFFEIAGDDPGVEYDQLIVSGTADINGTLHVQMLEGYTPPLGTTFDLIVAAAKGGGGLKSDIDCYSGLKINDDLILQPMVQPSGLSLVVVENTIVNDDPTAVDEWGETVEITPLTLYPLENDTDPDGDDISIVGVSETTQGGSAWINEDGVSVTYLPDPGFVGEDVFSYFITDCNGGSDEGRVSMYVGGAEPATLAFLPVANGPINCTQSATLSLHYTPNSVGRPVRGFSVTFGSSIELSFDAGDVVDTGILAGLADRYVFEVVTNDDGTLTVDAALLGTTSGLVQEADLFTVTVHSVDTGDGDVSITDYRLRDLDNLGFVADVQGATVVVDCIPPVAATALSASPGDGKVLVTWQDPGDTDLAGIEIWRGPWHDGSGNSLYPEYDDVAGNVIPTRPLGRTAAFDSPEWTLVGEVGPSGESFPDVGLDRGIYYYEVFARDLAGNYGPPATENDRATSYFLGDVRLPYDGIVNLADVTELGANYGLNDGDDGYKNEVDVGPTDDWSGSGIPETDNWINFDDLMIFAVNFEAFPPLLAGTIETGIAELEWSRTEDGNWVLALLEPCPTLKGLRIKARLQDGIKPGVNAGTLLKNQASPYFLRNVDGKDIDLGAAVFGSGMGIQGTGELIVISLPGDVIPGNLEIEARDTANKVLEINLEYEALSDIPSAYRLAQNYPNPFNPTTTIRFDLPEKGKVRLEIFGCNGGRVASLVDTELQAGFHQVIWDGRTDLGVQAASGIYFYQMKAGPMKQTRKMLLLK